MRNLTTLALAGAIGLAAGAGLGSPGRGGPAAPSAPSTPIVFADPTASPPGTGGEITVTIGGIPIRVAVPRDIRVVSRPTWNLFGPCSRWIVTW